MSKEIKNITKNELVVLLMGIDKSTFVNLTTLTDVRMNKTNNIFFGRVKKLSSVNYLVGNDYEKRVNSNEVKEGMEGDFESGELKGKKHVSKCVLVDTKTENTHYLMVERFDEIKPNNTFILDGLNPIEKTLFESYMVKVSENKSQSQEKKVMVITPKVENIKEISFGGVHYIVD